MIFGILAAAILAAIDRLLKMAVEQPRFDAGHHLGWRFFAFERFHNSGVAFSLPVPLPLALGLTIVFLIALVVWTRRVHPPLAHVALALIFLGAASNAFDRVTYAYTIDYLRLIDGIINLADVMVVCGIALLIFKKNH